ncbi:hypothetical protein WMY93_007818 [Mugilogobius chulae]|uniref:Fibronectin type-III domain-containing protein n=1 Tax=Mugilogobius chulae TaxID=88201 RepID=A0AAW0PHG1_9GOBI
MNTCLKQVLLIISLKFVHTTVDPPENLTIADMGHLGELEIRWRPSVGKEQGQCLVLYELHYYDSYTSSWTTIRTTLTSFRAQFDLTKEVKVRVYTLISGACAEVKSKNYTELVQKPDMTGMDGIQNLTCVFYDMEHLVCSWKRSSKMPSKTQEALYYWSGCNFSGIDLPTFSDVNLCVNASSGPIIRPVCTTLQIQNTVKPKAPGELHVEAGADRQLSVQWDSPPGRIPQDCLQWQVQVETEVEEGKHTLITSTENVVSLALPANETHCLRVRSMMNKYCADGGVWSDWSPSVCYPEKLKMVSAPSRDTFPENKYTAVTIISGVVLVLCVCACIGLKLSRHEKKREVSHSTQSAQSSAEIIPVFQYV